MTDKRGLRRICLARRNSLSHDEVMNGSVAIARHLQQIETFKNAMTVLSYVSKDNEVDTRDLIGSMLGEGRTVIVPIVQDTPLLTWSILEQKDDLAPGAFGILEPRPEKRRILTPPRDATVLVPGIAFAPSGHRIGYGRGYFDRFLATHEGSSIGLAFESQLIPEFPLSPHDVPVDIVVTESGPHPR